MTCDPVMPTQIGLISLGCAKNLIDSEIMIGHLNEAGMIMTPEPELADVLESDGYTAFVPAEELIDSSAPTKPSGGLADLFAL